MDIGAFVVADFEASVVVDGRDGLFDDIAIFAETAAVRGTAGGDYRRDAEPEQDGRVRRGVIGPVGEELFRPAAGVAVVGQGAGGDHGKHQDDIVNVGGADAAGQRDAGAIDEEMVFAAVFGSIGGVGASVYPPKTARTLEESMTHLDQSSLPAFWSSRRSTAWMSFQVPLACHSASRRQHDMPEPQFISAGRSSQGKPV